MRVNIYTEELHPGDGPEVEIVKKEYTNRDGCLTRNYGLRIFLKSASALHCTPRDDDRSAITIWCGPNPHGPQWMLEHLMRSLPGDSRAVDHTFENERAASLPRHQRPPGMPPPRPPQMKPLQETKDDGWGAPIDPDVARLKEEMARGNHTSGLSNACEQDEGA